MFARIRLADDTFDVRLDRAGADLEVEIEGDARTVQVASEKDAYRVKVSASRASGDRDAPQRVEIGDRTFHVKLDGASVVVDGVTYPLNVTDVRSAGGAAGAGPRGGGEIKPPMPGKVVAIKVKAGDKVEAGQTLLVLEAMKMQNELGATGAGTVKDVKVAVGQNVETKDVLIVIE